MSPVLDMRDIAVTHAGPAGPVPVLRGFSLTVAPGECVALRGPSGSGKSTALHVASGLLKPDRGRVRCVGADLATASDRMAARVRARRVGSVFQSFHLLAHLTAMENVLLATLIAGRPAREARDDARHALASVGLAGRASHRPDQLSGGEQQRVAIARAVVNGPDLVLADEPTGNLDRSATELVVGILAGLSRSGTAVLVATHDPEVAAVADRVVTMGRDLRITA